LFWAFNTFISHLENKKETISSLIKNHPIAAKNGLNEIEQINNVLNLFKLGDINKKTMNDETVAEFLKYHPEEAPQSAPKSGVKAVLNTYDKDGVLMDLGAEGYIEDSENKNI
jgi:hypothetical protein